MLDQTYVYAIQSLLATGYSLGGKMVKFVRLLVLAVGALFLLPLAVSFDADGNPSYPEWSTEQKDALYNLFKSFDPKGEGIDRSWLKKLNKGVGTNDLQKGLDALLADGRITSQNIVVPGAKVRVETFFWKGV